MATGNGHARHADAATSRLLDESERHEREAAERQREFAALLHDADEDDRDSEVAIEALRLGRAALASQHDGDGSGSVPPGTPWHVRWLPRPLRWMAALVVLAGALVGLLQALAALGHR